MITIKEMSKMLGLSTATISNVINGKDNQVSEATIKKVREVLEYYDYIPNMSARNLASSRSKLIGVGMVSYRENDNYLKDAFISELLGSIEANLKKYGYFMLTYFTPDPVDLARTILSWNVEGLILFGVGNEDCYNITKKFNKPKVLVDTYIDTKLVDSVVVGLEDEKGGYIAGKYLIELGHKKIAFFAENLVGINHLRYKGLKRAMQEEGLSIDIEDCYRLEAREDAVDEGLSKAYEVKDKYTAYFCASDYHALLIHNYFLDKGLSIPNDKSIIGYDDSIYSKIARPAISSIRQNPSKKGELAVEYIVKQIKENKILNNEILLPVELVKRDSVKSLL